MRKFLLILLCLLMVGCNRPDAYDAHDKPIRISDYKGKWVLINYWATWCKPCLKELPELDSTYLLNPDTVIVLGVSFDQLTNDAINRFGRKKRLNFPLLQSFPMEKFGVKEISSIPVTYLISPQGKLVATLNGPQTRADLEKAMGMKPIAKGEMRAL
jgi:peroxiredoxin